jgi:spore photoproduct lyase
VAWISVGLLRFSRELKKVVENRFPQNYILDGEFLLEFDGKMRYYYGLRKKVYATLVPHLQKLFPKAVVYVCMEKPHICPYSFQ